MGISGNKIVIELIISTLQKKSPQTVDQIYTELYWGLPKKLSISRGKVKGYLKNLEKNKKVLKKGGDYYFHGDAAVEIEGMKKIIATTFGANYAERMIQKELAGMSRTAVTITRAEIPIFLEKLSMLLKGQDPKMATVNSMLEAYHKAFISGKKRKKREKKREEVKIHKPVVKPANEDKVERKKPETYKSSRIKTEKGEEKRGKIETIKRRTSDIEKIRELLGDLDREIEIIPWITCKNTSLILAKRRAFSKKDGLNEEKDELESLAKLDAKFANILISLREEISELSTSIEKDENPDEFREKINQISKETALLARLNIQFMKIILSLTKRVTKKPQLFKEIRELKTLIEINMEVNTSVKNFRVKTLKLLEMSKITAL